MRILVTGGCGFIGSHICDALADHDIVAFDNLSSGKRERVKCEVVIGDITTPHDLDNAFKEFTPELVIHTAAQVMLRKSIDEPAFDAEQNILGTINVLEACRRHHVKKIIYTSTGGARYGEPERLPVKEEDPIRPVAPYGISKHTAEHYVESYSRLYGFDYLILAFGNVYGPRDDPKTKRVMSLFISHLQQNEQPMIFGDGEQTRDFLYVEDIARVIKENLTTQTKHKLFNLASGEPTSVNRIYTLVAKELGTTLKPLHKEAIAGEIRDITLDITKARHELHFTPTPIDEGIKKTVAWFKKD